MDDASLMWLSCVILEGTLFVFDFKQSTTKCPQSQHALSAKCDLTQQNRKKCDQTQQSVIKHNKTQSMIRHNNKQQSVIKHNKVWSNTTKNTLRHNTAASVFILCLRACCCWPFVVFEGTLLCCYVIKSTFCICGNIVMCVVIEPCWVTGHIFVLFCVLWHVVLYLKVSHCVAF